MAEVSESATPTVPLLNAVLRWQLTEARWRQVDELLERVKHAVQTGDHAQARQVTALLMLCGPRRVGRSVSEQLGATERTAAPGSTRELVNELVHTLAPDGGRDTDRR